MKLLIDAHVFDGSPQGTVTYLKGLYKALINLYKSEDIDFYFVAQDITNLKNIFGESPHIHYIRFSSGNKFFRLIFELPWLILKNKIDYAHFQYISPLFKCCKEIVTIHDLLFLDYPEYFGFKYKLKNKFFFSRSARRADLIFTVSEYSRKAISTHFGIPENNIHITPNGFELSKNDKFISMKEKYSLNKFILYISRFEPRKNHILLLQAYIESELYNEYDLVLIGYRDLKVTEFDEYYESLSNHLKQKIHFFSNVSNTDLEFFYRECNLFVFPSFAEGFGIPPLEAYLYNVPVLCSNATAMNDFYFLKDVFFNPNDIEELKTKMKQELKSPLLPTQDKYDEVLNKYKWSNIAKYFGSILTNK
ncbi:MAG: glycosyltransferase family 4 protein [Turicibacter sp.]